MKFIKILLLPIALLYGCLNWLRNKLYDSHLLFSKQFDIPLIIVGNLSVGGTGKSPHIEYLIRLLKSNLKVATLSRGYGRETDEFVLANSNSSAEEIGDEPRQFKNKFPDVEVAVDSNRVNGIFRLLKDFPQLNLILLDDAFQHRAVKAGLSILLTDYNNLYCDDYLLPTGTLREFKSGAKRANIIIVTKCPNAITSKERELVLHKIKCLSHQKVYFSFVTYGEIVPGSLFENGNLKDSREYALNKKNSVLLLTGIANPKPIEDYLKDKVHHLVNARFADHHRFTKRDITVILNLFNTIASENKFLVTTEKDWMRLQSSEYINLLNQIPIFYLPKIGRAHV